MTKAQSKRVSVVSIDSTCHSSPSSSMAGSKREGGISAKLALINFFKGMIGPGCFSLPLAFKMAGLWTGLALVFLIGGITGICMAKLVRCSQYLSKRNPRQATLDYGQMAAESFSQGFPKLRKLSKASHIIVNLCLIALQIGVCSIFYIFVCDHAAEVVEYFSPTTQLNKYVYMAIAFLPFVMISMIRDVRAMTFISLAGNVFMITSIIIIFTQLIIADHHIKELPAITDFNGIMMAAGAIIYSFEGQAMVLPLENRMKNGDRMLGFSGVLTIGLILVTTIYASSGFFGYITYGPTVQGSITLNLPDTPLNLAVKILLMLVIYTGFLVILYPMVEAILPIINKKMRDSTETKRSLAEYTLRFVCVAVAVGLAAAIPNLENIIPLVGVTAGMLLALIIPSILDTVTFLPVLLRKEKKVKAALLVVFNLSIFVLGMFFLVAGVISNVKNLTSSDPSS